MHLGGKSSPDAGADGTAQLQFRNPSPMVVTYPESLKRQPSPGFNAAAPSAQRMISGQVGVVGIVHPVVADADQSPAIGHQPGVIAVARVFHIGSVPAMGRVQVGDSPVVAGDDHRRAGNPGGGQPGQDSGNGDRLVAFGYVVGFDGQAESGRSGGLAGRNGNGGRGGGGEILGRPLFGLPGFGSARHGHGDGDTPGGGGHPCAEFGADGYGLRVVGGVFGNLVRAHPQDGRIGNGQRIGYGQPGGDDGQPGRPAGDGQRLSPFRLLVAENDQAEIRGGAGGTGRDGQGQVVPGLEVGTVGGGVLRYGHHRGVHQQIPGQGGRTVRESGDEGSGESADAGGRLVGGVHVQAQNDRSGIRVAGPDGEDGWGNGVPGSRPGESDGFGLFYVQVVAQLKGQGGGSEAGVGRDDNGQSGGGGKIPGLRLIHVGGGRIVGRAADGRIAGGPDRYRNLGGDGGRGGSGFKSGGNGGANCR